MQKGQILCKYLKEGHLDKVCFAIGDTSLPHHCEGPVEWEPVEWKHYSLDWSLRAEATWVSTLVPALPL